MSNRQVVKISHRPAHLLNATVLAPVALIAATAISMAPVPAHALPAYAEQTGLPCGQCHIDPSGGGPRTAFGKAFAANGHRLPGKRRGHGYEHRHDYYNDGYDHGMMGGYGHGMMGR
jgi:hypothetical protein